MRDLVYQMVVVGPEPSVDALLLDLLNWKLHLGFPDQVAVAGLRASSERGDEFERIARKGRLFSVTGLHALLTEVSVTDGWFFVGAPAQPGDPIEPVDVTEMLSTSAYVIDVLEARFLFLRTLREQIFRRAQAMVVGAETMEPCDLKDVQLAY